MQRFTLAAALGGLACVVGCSAADSDTSEAESAIATIASLELPDNVEVKGDRLVFAPRVRGRAELAGIDGRVNRWNDVYRSTRAAAPTTLAADAADDWALDHVRAEADLEPVILVGRRQADAVRPDGSIDTSVPNPYGYLVRAVGVERGPAGETIVRTEPATLLDALSELERSGRLSPAEAASLRDAEANPDDDYDRVWNHPFTVVDVDLNRTLYEKQLGAGLGRVFVGFEDSYFEIDGNFDARMAGKRWRKPRVAHAIANVEMRGKVNLVGSFDAGFGAESGPKVLYQRSFAIASLATFELSADFEVVAECSVAANGKARAEVGAEVKGSLKAGAAYTSEGGARMVWEPEYPRFTRIGPSLTTDARVEGRCSVTARVRSHVFNDAGPEAHAGAYVALDVAAQTAGASGSVSTKVTAGVDAGSHVTLRPFGLVTIADFAGPAYRRDWVLFDQPFSLR